jgi:hypothetical protein
MTLQVQQTSLIPTTQEKGKRKKGKGKKVPAKANTNASTN